MKTRTLLVFALWWMACPGMARSDDPLATRPATSVERPEDSQAIRALGVAFTQAYEKGDAKAVAELFTEDAQITNVDGLAIRGRKAIVEHFAEAFAASPHEKIENTTDRIDFLGPDLARETGRSTTRPAVGGAPERTRYAALLVRREGKWLQASVEETPDPAMTPHERLLELEWLLGDWVDESEEAVVHTTCRWSEDGNYLLRDFTMRVRGLPVMSGTQRIGWDARAGQFKSWVFDQDGGHSEGLWGRNGKDQWIIHASGVLADGRTVVATQLLTFVEKGLIRWRSVSRAVGGEAVPDSLEIVLVRTPPKPGANAAAK